MRLSGWDAGRICGKLVVLRSQNCELRHALCQVFEFSYDRLPQCLGTLTSGGTDRENRALPGQISNEILAGNFEVFRIQQVDFVDHQSAGFVGKIV